jgi:hypothetical protein
MLTTFWRYYNVIEDEDDLFLFDLTDLYRFYGVREYVKARMRKAAREARLKALDDCKRVLDAYDPQLLPLLFQTMSSPASLDALARTSQAFGFKRSAKTSGP